MAMERFNALSLGEKLIAGGGVLMFIAGFLPWWSWSEGGFSGSSDGWSFPGSMWSVLVVIVSLALLAVVLAPALANVKLPDLPPNVTWGMVYGGAAAAIVVLMLLKLWRILAFPAGGVG